MDVSTCSDNAALNDDIAPHAMAFTVHFDNGKQSGIESFNKFTRRHIRNLSLPIAKVYENKVVSETQPLNEKQSIKKAGNHSEGYFSSDPDDDPAKPKLFVAKVKNSESKLSNPTNLAQGKKNMSQMAKRPPGKLKHEEEIEDEETSDVISETGTYTIDKESSDVTTARLNIDSAFGVHNTNESQIKFQMSSTHGKSTWINEWATQVVEHNHHSSIENQQSPTKSINSTTNGGNVTKIPSPINCRARLPPMTQPMKSEHHDVTLRNVPNRKLHVYSKGHGDCSDNNLETECFLKATERVVSAMAARVSKSLDSGGESDIESNSLNQLIMENAIATDSSASESGQKPTPTRYNRAFSLRRGRLDEPKKESTPVRESALSKVKIDTPLKVMPPRLTKRDLPSVPVPASSPSFSRTDCGRFSMRVQRPSPQSPLISTAKKDIKKKSNNCNRSNSTLSSKEVEFQNWKRRKSYDPMKAAAEGKKKEAARKQQPAPNPMTQSTITTPKSPVNPVLRSASFHGTRQLAASSSDDEEEEEVILSAEEDWPVLQVPRSSLENTPQGSHISLYSNNSASSLRARPKLEKISRTSRGNKGEQEEGVDTLVISALSGLSSKLKGSSCNLLKKLRYLYDEDSPKGHQLSAEIEQLEASEPGSPQVKSPSRELSTTLRNLKRLENMLKVLDDVLFDEEDF